MRETGNLLQRGGRFAILGALFLGTLSWALAQSTTASIEGIVKDASGGVIPGVEVRATEVGTGFSRSTVSSDAGFYRILQLEPGTYEVKAELTGFKSFVAREIRLQVRDTLRLDIVLEVGSISEVVTVAGAATTVDTQKAELGKVVENKDIIDLPLNGRNALQLALLQPGTVPPEPGAVSGSNFSVGGQRGQNNNFLLEGGNNNDLAANFPTSNPNVEALQEFKVQSSSYDAEFGRNSGAQINVVVKSGTNQWHGDIFEFHRNTVLDARDFFLNDRQTLLRNQFGGTYGGPILKDKFFIFGSYEGFRERTQQAITNPLVPSAALRQGNVGSLLNGTGQAFLDPDGDGVIAVSPIAKALLDRFVPLPNGPVDPTTGLGQLSSAAGASTDRDQFIVKGDYNFSEGKNLLSVTYLLNDSRTFDPTAFGNPSNTVPGFGASNNGRTQNAIINDVHTFSPNFINTARLSYNRLSQFGVVPEDTTNPKDLGFSGVNTQNGLFPSTPNVRVTGAFSLGGSIQGPQGRGDDTFDLSDTVNWVVGDHNLKMGGEWAHFNQDQLFNFANNGLFFFAGVFGDPIVDFLAGTPLLYIQAALPDLHFRENSFSGFFNDEWRVNDRLTLNLGVRYDWFLPTHETRDKIGTVDFTGGLEIGTAQSTRFPNAPPGLLFPGDPGVPRATTDTDKVNIAPRVGFAYDLTGNGKLALRGGYGIYYNIINTELQLQFLLAQPFGLQQTLGPLAGGVPFQGGLLGGLIGSPDNFASPFLSNNPFPFVSPASDFILPIDFTVLSPHLRIPYSHQYSLSLQWEVLENTLLEVAYVGSTGINLLNRNVINTLPFQRNPDNTINVLGDTPGNPNFVPNITIQSTNANSHYNSLQVSLNRRFNSGLGFLASYTYAHSTDNASGVRDFPTQDPFRLDLENGNSNFDITQRFVFSGEWELPFGKGRRFGSGATGLAGKLIEGWQVGGIISADDGFPVDFGVSGASTTGTLAFSDRPQLAGDPGQGVKGGDTQGQGVDPNTFFFNRDAFIRCDDTAKGGVGGPCFGNLGRNRLRGPGDFNVDMVVLKRTSVPQINENAAVEFRFEVFNLFNNPNFGQPGSTLGAGNFGRITSTKNGFGPRIIQFALKLRF